MGNQSPEVRCTFSPSFISRGDEPAYKHHGNVDGISIRQKGDLSLVGLSASLEIRLFVLYLLTAGVINEQSDWINRISTSLN